MSGAFYCMSQFSQLHELLLFCLHLLLLMLGNGLHYTCRPG